MKSKRGEFLTKEGLELLLAVIAILLVIAVVGALWNIFVNSEEQNAKKTANLIEAKINALGEGQSNTFLVQGFTNSENWIIVGWSKGEQERPDACYFDSCVCVCEGSSLKPGLLILFTATTIPDDVKQSCKKKGFCRTFKADNIFTSENGKFSDGKEYNSKFFFLKKNIFGLEIVKEANEIKITFNNPEVNTVISASSGPDFKGAASY